MKIGLLLPKSSWVQIDIYTLAFRRIRSEGRQMSGADGFTWDLTDKEGTAVSNGLYYIRVQVGNKQPVTKNFKVIVTK